MTRAAPDTARGYPRRGSLDVLFVTYGGGHVQAILPVAQALHDAGRTICIFALTTAAPVVEKSGLPWFTYADLPQAHDAAVQQTGRRLAAQMPAGNALPAAETRAYLGINYLDMVARLGPDAAAQAWDSVGRQKFFPLGAMTRLLEDLAPKLVMATNSPRSEQAAIEAAGASGIPALCLVDLFALQEVAWLRQPGFARELFVLDEGVRQMLVNHGRPAADIVVTGNPAFDSLHDPATIAVARRMRADRGWDREGRISLLYASSPEPDRHPFTGEPADPALPRRLEEHLRALVEADPRYELIVRRHPSEDQIIAPGARIHASPRSDDINALVQAVDVVIVTCSTVGLQAYLAGTPVVSVECSVFSRDAPYGVLGMSTAVPDFEAIAPALTGVVTRPRAAAARPETAVSKILARMEPYLQ